MTHVQDFLWGSIQYDVFAFFGAYSERPVGSPTAWKNKQPRPVAVLIPGYIFDDTSLIYLGGSSENRFFGTYQIL